MNLTLEIIATNGRFTVTDRLLRYSLEKDVYTPYTKLSFSFAGTITQISLIKNAYRIQVSGNNTVLHFGTIDKLEFQVKGTEVICRGSSKGLTALLLWNQLPPGIYPNLSLNELMTRFCTLPEGITWEPNTDTTNYLYVGEHTSLWEGAANLSFKLLERYPYIYGANQISYTVPTAYRSHSFYTGEYGYGVTCQQSGIYSDFYMADASGDYSAFHETDALAQARGIVRTKQLPLDEQYLYNPQKALEFRRKYADKRLITYYAEFFGTRFAEIGDRLTIPDICTAAYVTGVQYYGDQNGSFTKISTYCDGFYPEEE